MDRTGYFLLLLVPLVLALLCGGLEVFTLLTNLESRRLATEYSRQSELESNLAELDEAVLNNLTVTVKALLEQSEALRQKMEMLGMSRGEEIASIALQLEDILSVLLNGTTQASEEDFANKTVLLREGCKTMSSTCPTASPGPKDSNYTFIDCTVGNTLSNQEGEIVGKSQSGYLIGKMVYRKCSFGSGRESLDLLNSIPSVGSALEYISEENAYVCRCYQMANNTVMLSPTLCSFTVTVCNERGTLAV